MIKILLCIIFVIYFLIFSFRSFEKTQEEYEKTKHQLSELEQAEQKRKAELLRLNDRKKKLITDIANEEKKVCYYCQSDNQS